MENGIRYTVAKGKYGSVYKCTFAHSDGSPRTATVVPFYPPSEYPELMMMLLLRYGLHAGLHSRHEYGL